MLIKVMNIKAQVEILLNIYSANESIFHLKRLSHRSDSFFILFQTDQIHKISRLIDQCFTPGCA